MASKEKITAHQKEHTGSSRILLDPEGEWVGAQKLKHTSVMKQDNDPQHSSKSTCEWLKNQMKILEWSSQSLVFGVI